MTITEDQNYVPYVSKSDRPKGRAKELKAMGRNGNAMAFIEANELLSPSRPLVPKIKNQRQKRDHKRSNPNA